MFFYWAMMLTFSGMYTMYIIDIGFSRMQVGIAATIYVLSAFTGQNAAGYIADRFGHIKRIIFFCVATGFVIAALLTLSRDFIYVCGMIFLWGFFLRGSIPLSELWFIRALGACNSLGKFGLIRGFGSIGYGLSGVITGYLLMKAGWNVLAPCIAVAVGIALLTMVLIRNIDDERPVCRARISYSEAIKEISKISELKKVILVVFMYTFTVSGIYSYLGVLISDFGGSAFSLGTVYLFDAGPEIVTFFLTSRLMSRFGSKKLIVIAFFLQIIRLALLMVFNSPTAVILLGAFSGFAYGLIASSYKTYVYELAPDKYKASCSGLSESLIGLSAILSAPVFGFLILRFGAASALATGLVINLAAVSVLMLNKEKRAAIT